MIIKSITLENFKGIKKPVRLDIRPITLLFGPNSAGKSTILQALVYAREILERHNLDPDHTILGGEWMDLGGFNSLVNNHDLDTSITIGFELDLSEEGVSDYLSPSEVYMLESWEHQYSPGEWLDNVQHAAVLLSICWDERFKKPIIKNLKIDINFEELAEITCDKDALQVGIKRFNHSHSIFRNRLVDKRDKGSWFVDELLVSGFKVNASEERDNEVTMSHRTFLELYGSNEDVTIARNDRIEFGLESPEFNNERDGGADLSEDADVSPFGVVGLVDQQDALPVKNRKLQITSDIWESTREARSPYSDHPLAAQLLITSVFSGLIVGPLDVLRSELDKLLYIGPLRDVPKRERNVLRSPESSRWARGMAAWDTMLEAPEPLIDNVNEWLGSEDKFNSNYRVEYNHFKLIDVNSPIYKALSDGLNVEIDELSELVGKHLLNAPEKIELSIVTTDTGTRLEPADLGVGISQVIPVIVSALNSKSDLIAIEQPELHIHPGWQVVLGDLFASSINKSGAMFFIETHSEHLLLRLLRRIRQTTDKELAPGEPALRPDQLAVYFVESSEEGVDITHIRIDEDGEFKDRWPKGFFGERRKELM